MTRNKKIATIHIAKSRLGMSDDTYRGMIREHGGASSGSCRDLDRDGLDRVIQHLYDAGYRPFDKRAVTGKPGLVYHLWGRLHDAGLVKDKRGLFSWIKRQTKGINGTGWRRPELCPPDVLDSLIESLKHWLERA